MTSYAPTLGGMLYIVCIILSIIVFVEILTFLFTKITENSEKYINNFLQKVMNKAKKLDAKNKKRLKMIKEAIK